MVITMRKTLLLLCVILALSSCQSTQEAEQELQRQTQEEAQRWMDQAKEEAEKSWDSFLESIRQGIDSWTKSVQIWWQGVQDWWSGIWGSAPATKPEPGSEPQPETGSPVIYVINTNRVNGRQCARIDSDCKPVVTFKRGDEITVTGTTQGEAVLGNSTWLVVSHEGSAIYVHSSLADPKVTLANVPSHALLPFEGTKDYTGGPHASNNMRICIEKELDAADGIDFASREDPNFEVLSIAEGVILDAVEWDGKSTGAGTFVKILHPNGLISEYWHLSRLSDEVKELMKGSNREVVQGFPLGFAGNTGNQTAVHLHLRISRSWHGQSIDGWTIWMHLKPGSNSIGFNYQGSATKGQTKEHQITLSASACNSGMANAIVGHGFTGTEESNGVDGNTLFAEDGGRPRAPMTSSNRRRTN